MKSDGAEMMASGRPLSPCSSGTLIKGFQGVVGLLGRTGEGSETANITILWEKAGRSRKGICWLDSFVLVNGEKSQDLCLPPGMSQQRGQESVWERGGGLLLEAQTVSFQTALQGRLVSEAVAGCGWRQ